MTPEYKLFDRQTNTVVFSEKQLQEGRVDILENPLVA